MSQIEADAQQFASLLVALTPLIRSGVENEVIHDDTGYGIKLSGFYKDGTVTVRAGDGQPGHPIATVRGRYEDLDEIYEGSNICEALIRLNAERFRYWNSVKPEFNTIDGAWLPLLKGLGLVKEQVSHVLA